VAQAVAAPELVEDALRLTNAALTRHDIKVIRQFEATGPITVDKHKALQILVNLLQNAKNACAEAPVEEKLVTVITVARGADFVKILVVDNGVGIAPENLTRMFAHGFTTRKDGHGFGLHSGALAAREMGGSLTAWSAGPGRGATFTLELPRENSNAVK
jgi:C4-dicarboxylate-specific signal transduction histidine kinase